MNEHSPDASEPLPTAGAAPAGPNNLFRGGVAVLVAGLAYYALFAEVRDPLHLLLGLCMFTLALLPALNWTRSRQAQIPIFAILTLTTLNTYALPLLNGHQDLNRYSVDTITRGAVAVLLFQAVTILVHRLVRVEPGQGDYYEREIIDEGSRPWLFGGLALVSAYAVASTLTTLIPSEINSVLRAMFSGLGMICTFVCMRDWGRGRLQVGGRILVVSLLLIQILAYFSTLVMVTGISLLCLALIGYVSGAHRIPFLIILLLIPVIAILHNGKSAMRTKFWPASSTVVVERLTLSGLPEFYAEWFEQGLSIKSATEQTRHDELAARLIDRSSLFHMLCMVVHYTPDRQPYLEGDTYWDIPGQFVPRFLWPDKPRGHISTTKLSIYYGLQREEDAEKTTIGFGLLPEAYANFGMFGVIGLGAFFGALFKWIELRTVSSPLLSLAGIMLIIFTAWSFQTEFPLSMWLSSLGQACLVVLVLPLLYRKLFG